MHWVPQHRRRIFIVGFDKKQIDTKQEGYFVFPNEPITELRIGDILQKRVQDKYTLRDGTWNSLQTIRARNRSLPKGKKKGFGFSLVDRDGPSRTLTKRYFKDGAEVIVTGQYLDGIFYADELQTKCASRYEGDLREESNYKLSEIGT